MKPTLAALAAVVMIGVSTPVLGAEFTKGTVTKVDAAQKKVTIKHEELKNLDMPAMTMVFGIADEALMEKIKAGANIQFVAERVNGRIMVTDIK